MWARRRYIRRRRRRFRRKKIKITQWNPAVTKKCTVTGYLPVIYCGTGDIGTTFQNFGSHMNEYKQYNSAGGGFSTMLFTMQNLYEEYQKHRCKWSKSNQDLELVRYLGCELTFYRSPNTDFIVGYNRKPPFIDTQITGCALHPGMLIQERKKVIIPSFQTRPKGRIKRKIKVRPPTLFTDKWYFQRDLCKVPLVTVSASAASLRFPFGSPQTENYCIYFQVLDPWYHTRLSITGGKPAEYWTQLKAYLTQGWGRSTNNAGYQHGPLGTYFNTLKTAEHIRQPPADNYKQANKDTTYYGRVDSHWGDHVYQQTIIQAMEENQSNMYTKRALHTFLGSQYLNFKSGLFSSILLDNARLSPDFKGMYQEVVYNPFNDRGVGNKVWVQWCTNEDTIFKDLPGRVPVVDLPLWCALMGYSDYCKKYFHDDGFLKEARITIISPYTNPPLINNKNPNEGFVPYSFYFGKGRMPDGNGYIPIDYRFNWYPCIFHQTNWINDMVQCGPFAYHGDEKNCCLTMKYKFKFLFGGNPISQQTIKDPCQQPDWQLPGSGRFPRDVQVSNPRLQTEGSTFHAWDFRRGFYGKRAIERLQGQQDDVTYIAGPPKRPRFEVPALAAEGSSNTRRSELPWQTSEEESSQEENSEETEEETSLSQQLKQQCIEQKLLKRTLHQLVKQLVKTQYHLHAPIIH